MLLKLNFFVKHTELIIYLLSYGPSSMVVRAQSDPAWNIDTFHSFHNLYAPLICKIHQRHQMFAKYFHASYIQMLELSFLFQCYLFILGTITSQDERSITLAFFPCCGFDASSCYCRYMGK